MVFPGLKHVDGDRSDQKKNSIELGTHYNGEDLFLKVVLVSELKESFSRLGLQKSFQISVLSTQLFYPIL
jgi:hypothetical protein